MMNLTEVTSPLLKRLAPEVEHGDVARGEAGPT